VELRCSGRFISWLKGLHLSLAFTTYNSNRLFLVGLKEDGQLSTQERLFERTTGLYANAQTLHLSSRHQLWRFENVLPSGELYEGHDRLYVPRAAYTVGDLDIHDLGVDKNGRVMFVNTRYSCLSALSPTHSFTPIWKPPFISKIAPEDRCHLNGLAMVDGEPGFVTSISRSDVASGWRDRIGSGGCVIDAHSNEIVCDGLSLPNSPRFYQDRLWLLNSGTGEFGYVDRDAGTFEPVVFCPGFVRGLSFFGNYAVAGLSRPRSNRSFSGLELESRLDRAKANPFCGLLVIDINRGEIVHQLMIEGAVEEIYDVRVLPLVNRPTALGVKTDDFSRIITVDPESPVEGIQGGVFIAPPSAEPSSQTSSSELREPSGYRFQSYQGLNQAQALEYDALSFPKLSEKWLGYAPLGSMTVAAAALETQLVAAGVAVLRPRGLRAEIISLFALPDYRRQGLGGRILFLLEKNLVRQGCEQMEINYRSDWPGCAAVERILHKQGWEPPEDTWMLAKTTMERQARSPYINRYGLGPDYETFPWTKVTDEERQYIKEKQEREQWFQPMMSPFQNENKLEPLNSLGLRYKGRIVGWMITHRTVPDTIEYTALFVDKEHRREGQASGLTNEAIKLQIASDIPNMIYMVDMRNEAMRKFLNRRPEDEPVSDRNYTRTSRKWLKK